MTVVKESYSSISPTKKSHCSVDRDPNDTSTTAIGKGSANRVRTRKTVFGRILHGDLPAAVLAESQELLAFKDIRPWAPLHALIIPKDESIVSVYDLHGRRSDDNDNNSNNTEEEDTHLQLLRQMQDMGEDLVKYHQPDAFKRQDYKLCYHIPPFTEVPHLHLHVLAPASDLSWVGSRLYFRSESRWCTSHHAIVERLAASGGRSKSRNNNNNNNNCRAVPYRHVSKLQAVGLLLSFSALVALPFWAQQRGWGR